jgi:hypothetical protein
LKIGYSAGGDRVTERTRKIVVLLVILAFILSMVIPFLIVMLK